MSYDLFLFALPSEMTVHLLLSLVTPILWNVKCVFLRKRMSLAKPAGYRQDMLKPADIEFCVQRSDLSFLSIQIPFFSALPPALFLSLEERVSVGICILTPSVYFVNLLFAAKCIFLSFHI